MRALLTSSSVSAIMSSIVGYCGREEGRGERRGKGEEGGGERGEEGEGGRGRRGESGGGGGGRGCQPDVTHSVVSSH